jgi:hypothetical protein
VAANDGVLGGGRKSLLVGSSGAQLGGDCSEKTPSMVVTLGHGGAALPGGSVTGRRRVRSREVVE